MTSEMSHVRKPSLAMWLSSFCCGLGQIYCGRVGRGLVMYSVSMMAWLVIAVLALLGNATVVFTGLAALVVALIAFNIWSSLDAKAIARSMAAIDYEPQEYNRPVVYGLMIATWFPYAIGLAFFLRSNVVEAYYLPTACMTPSFLPGDRVLANKVGVETTSFTHGDVVVFRNPQNRKQNFIKRIIGLPGETVEMKEGKVFINDEPLPQEPTPEGDQSPPVKVDGKKARYEQYGPRRYAVVQDEKSDMISLSKQTVPIGSYFVLGDHRSQSLDSREFGPIPHGDIVGQVFLNYWPSGSWKRFGAVR